MKCPKCGNEIEEGKLLCEKCGEEVKIVPDFDPEIESQINETLGNIAKSAFEKEKQEPEIDELQDDFEKDKWSEYIIENKKRLIILLSFLFIIVTGITVYKIVSYNHYNTFDYQYGKALELSKQNKNQEAIDYLDRALAIDSNHVNARILLADLYTRSQQYNSAMKVLEESVLMDSQYQEEAYDHLLSLYETQQKYEKMGVLLKKCPYEKIVNKYERFTAFEPVFNIEGGVYDKVQSVTMKNSTEGIIYYTLDGSTPTRNSMVYEYPIALETGNYTIKAFFVNMYGVESNIVTKTYYISLSRPLSPDISLESGTYDEPQMIEIFHDENTKVYYTLDGTIPDKNSSRYTEPLEMLYGTSNLSVVAINDNNVSSDVVRRTFTLKVQTNFTEDLALQVLHNQLIMNHVILDYEGHISNKLGVNQYQVQTIIDIMQNRYFIISEKYIDTMGKEHATNNYYAVDVNTAELFNARKIREGEYILSKMNA